MGQRWSFQSSPFQGFRNGSGGDVRGALRHGLSWLKDRIRNGFCFVLTWGLDERYLFSNSKIVSCLVGKFWRKV